jgi:hypothetical protein
MSNQSVMRQRDRLWQVYLNACQYSTQVLADVDEGRATLTQLADAVREIDTAYLAWDATHQETAA